MGTLSYTTKCGPDGQTVVTLNATNGYLDVTIDGQLATVDSDGDGNHDIVTGPGEHTAVWWKPGTTERIPENVWGSKTITVDALTNCAAPPTTTTPSPAPTAPPEVTESTTALAPPSTITPQIDMDVDPCVTSATGCTVAVGVPPTLPATGLDSGGVLLGVGSLALAVGVIATVVARRRKPTSAQKRQVAARLHEVTS
jgi:LPXTG-motif cell wall-anchored protein